VLDLGGHSMGAPVIRQYAIDHPEHVAGLVSVDGILDLRSLGSGQVQLPPPTLAVAAGTSTVQDPAAVRDVYPNFESTQVPGTGHFLMMEKPEEFNRILADFLERIDF
jgi:pimeloyl-ACP methyl ester carboxylesterase